MKEVTFCEVIFLYIPGAIIIFGLIGLAIHRIAQYVIMPKLVKSDDEIKNKEYANTVVIIYALLIIAAIFMTLRSLDKTDIKIVDCHTQSSPNSLVASVCPCGCNRR